MKYEEIVRRVGETLVEALKLDKEKIVPKAKLQADLGADSMDFLYITFCLERAFNIKIHRDELFPQNIFYGDPEMVQNGKLTAQGLADLRARLPFVDLAQFEKNPQILNIPDLFTVDFLCKYIQHKLPSP